MITTYLVSYDLHTPGRDYSTLIDGIKKLSTTWAKPLESVWLVQYSGTAVQLRDALKRYVDANDTLLVMQVGGGWGTLRVANDVTDWMKRAV